MNWEVYWQSTVLKRWKKCGVFENLVLANEHIDYLQNNLPAGSKILFKVVTVLKSIEINYLAQKAS